MSHLTILGGGPAGIAIGYYGHRQGHSFSIHEKLPDFGGLCRTLRFGDHRYDTGAHRLHDQFPAVTADLKQLMGDELVPVTSPSKIYENGKSIDFPPTPLNLLRSTSIPQLGTTVFDLLRARLRRGEDRSFEDFATRKFGRSLARRFLMNYSEKVWGYPSRELAPEVSTKRLSGMTLGTLVRELLFPQKKADHIDGTFLYPLGGYGRIMDALLETLPQESLRPEEEVTGFSLRHGRVERIDFGSGDSILEPEHVVSTLPLTALVRLLRDQLPADVVDAARSLRFRSLRLFVLKLNRPRISNNATIYFPHQDFVITRIHEPKNRSERMAPPHETSLVVEVPHFNGDEIHSLETGRLLDRVLVELVDSGMIERGEVLDTRHHFLPAAYPVYRLDYQHAVAKIREGLAPIENLTTLGRGGLFFYSHLHHQLDWARRFVDSLDLPEAATESSWPSTFA